MRIVGERWRILAEIAAGGMGTVFEAQHVVTEQRVALKVLHPHLYRDAAHQQRFLREVTAPARIGHEGICKVYDAGFDRDGSPYLAMELLEGETLREALARGLSIDAGLDAIDAMLDALIAAHQRGFVHRDLKPENVFLTRPDGVKLLDFGIVSDASGAALTATGAAVGTPLYMSPEQSMDVGRVGAATDVWAIGVMLYELVTGHPPFTGDTPNAILVHACTRPHRPVLELAPHVATDLATLIDRCLEKNPDLRPSTAVELRSSLRRARVSRRVAATAPMPSPVRSNDARSHGTPASPTTSGAASTRHRIVAIALMAGTLVACALVLSFSFSSDTVAPPPPALPPPAPHPDDSQPIPGATTTSDVVPARCDGVLPVSRVGEVLEPLRADLRRCHREVPDAPSRGTVSMTLTIGRDGEVTNVTTPGDLQAEVESCARDAARALRFPPLSTGECATVVEQFAMTAPSGAARPRTEAPVAPSGEGLPAADLRTVVQRERRGLQECWDVAVRRMPDAPTSRVDIDLSVDPSGAVSDVTARGGPPGVSDCIEQHVRGWRFPASSGTTTLSLPVVFQGS